MSEAIDGVLQRGGWVAEVLVAICLLLWFVAALRAFAVWRGFAGPIEALVIDAAGKPRRRRSLGDAIVVAFVARAEQVLRQRGACGHDLDRWTAHALDQTHAYASLLHSLVVAAPLLGLLGTVSGMIETFASMHGAVGHATEQTVAGGISVALVTTQIGLVIGISGAIAARLLDRLAAARRRELLAARSLLSARLATEAA